MAENDKYVISVSGTKCCQEVLYKLFLKLMHGTHTVGYMGNMSMKYNTLSIKCSYMNGIELLVILTGSNAE